MKLALKSSVVPNIRVDFAVALGWIKALWTEFEADGAGLGPFIVTSLKDGTHGAGSQHKQDAPADVPGEAADIRTRHLFDEATGTHKPALSRFAQRLQQAGFRVIIHPDWMAGTPHLHVGLGKDGVLKMVE